MQGIFKHLQSATVRNSILTLCVCIITVYIWWNEP